MGVRTMDAHAGIIAHAGKYISLTGNNSHRSHKWETKSKAHAKDKIILYSLGPEFILKSNRGKNQCILITKALSKAQMKESLTRKARIHFIIDPKGVLTMRSSGPPRQVTFFAGSKKCALSASVPSQQNARRHAERGR